MSRLYISIISIFAMLLAACSTPEPNPQDWCYKYDFLAGANSVGNGYGVPVELQHINIQAGGWVPGIGLKTVNNELIINWQEDFYFRPSLIQVKVWRGYNEPIEPPISVAINANIFSVIVNGQTDGLAAYEQQRVWAVENTNHPNTDFNAASITLQSDREIVIEWLKVYGGQPSPFGVNNCQIQPTATATVPISTSTPSNTPTPDATATRTPTPTGTLSLCWEVNFDFTQGQEGWNADYGSYVAGVGFINAPQYATYFKSNGIGIGTAGYAGTNVSNIRINYVYSPGEGASLIKINGGLQTISAATPSTFIEWNGSQSFAASMAFEATVGYKEGVIPSPEGSIVVTSARFRGYGGSPTTSWITNGGTVTYIPCHDQTSTPTTTPSATVFTNTPTATRTRTPLPITPSTSTPSRTPLPGIVTATPSTPTITPTRTSSSTPLPLPPTNTPAPTNTPGPTNTPYAPPTYTTATGFPVSTLFPAGYTPTYGGTGVPGPWGTPFGTPEIGGSTAIPTLENLPTSDNLERYHQNVYDNLNTAVANINSLPAQMDSQLPDINENLTLFAGYGRWISSGVSLQEILGQKIYPIGVHIFYAFAIVVFLSTIRMIIWVVEMAIRVARWIIESILKIIPFIG